MATLFRENGIDADRINYFNEPFTEQSLRKLIMKLGLTPYEILRKGEAQAKELGLNADTPPGEIIKYIVQYPALLQRPIVEVGGKAILARPAEKALDIVG
ncbi:MAG TPA: ArsC/Spx/MgsR family protein [Pyrinomonadaceae bacterium]|nr:ArsC/Spx/MgsR family protein [Pyrinomonadaceae bacterium]